MSDDKLVKVYERKGERSAYKHAAACCCREQALDAFTRGDDAEAKRWREQWRYFKGLSEIKETT